MAPKRKVSHTNDASEEDARVSDRSGSSKQTKIKLSTAPNEGRASPTKKKAKAGSSSTGASSHIPSLEDFLGLAEELDVTIAQPSVERSGTSKGKEEIKFSAKPKEMSTGSYGWTGSKNAKINVGDQPTSVSISINVVVQNSKDSKGKGK
ncbi:hypothetical protein IAT40_005173 [Kwoniella sp. CBS 6097]